MVGLYHGEPACRLLTAVYIRIYDRRRCQLETWELEEQTAESVISTRSRNYWRVRQSLLQAGSILSCLVSIRLYPRTSSANQSLV